MEGQAQLQRRAFLEVSGVHGCEKDFRKSGGDAVRANHRLVADADYSSERIAKLAGADDDYIGVLG